MLSQEAATQASLPASSLHWHFRQSRDVVIAKKCGKQRMSSRHAFGETNFQIMALHTSVLHLDTKLSSREH